MIKSHTNNKQVDSKTIKIRTLTLPMEQDNYNNKSSIPGHEGHYLEQERVLKETEKQANQMMEDAKQQIKVWKEELEASQLQLEGERERVFREAEQQGQQNGYNDGLLQGKLEYEANIKESQQIITKAKEDYYKRIEESETIMLDLAVELAEKIIGKTLEENPQAWLHLLKEAVEEVRGHEEVKILVHPKQYEITSQHQHELKQLALHTNALYIFPDHSLKENACIIETPFGQVEASVDSQLKEIKRILYEKLKEGQHYEA
ncbi:flagellar assembly protein FliH [Evansella tamaricis]|uniref:flagellar assembly protein FliH n=1 Tax=Evansella tamaricis TaxID=2069301 RepID=UPI0031B82B57